MKRLLAVFLLCVVLAGCSVNPSFEEETPSATNEAVSNSLPDLPESSQEPLAQQEIANEGIPAINYEWYRERPVFTCEDGRHTFQMGWQDDYLQFIIDDMDVIGGTSDVDDSVVSGGLLYESIDSDGTVSVVYYYAENYIQITDNRNGLDNYSGVYLPNADATSSNESNHQVSDWYSKRMFLNADTEAFFYASETSNGELMFRVNHRAKCIVKMENAEVFEDKERGGYSYRYVFQSDNGDTDSANDTIIITYNTKLDSVIIYDAIAYPFDSSGVYSYWQDFPN